MHWRRDYPAPQWWRWCRAYWAYTPPPAAPGRARTYVWVVKVFLYRRCLWVSWWDKRAYNKRAVGVHGGRAE